MIRWEDLYPADKEKLKELSPEVRDWFPDDQPAEPVEIEFDEEEYLARLEATKVYMRELAAKLYAKWKEEGLIYEPKRVSGE